VELVAALAFAVIVSALLAFALFRPARPGPITAPAITSRPKLLDVQYTRSGPVSDEAKASSAAPAGVR
jgi:hypothetical protein